MLLSNNITENYLTNTLFKTNLATHAFSLSKLKFLKTNPLYLKTTYLLSKFISCSYYHHQTHFFKKTTVNTPINPNLLNYNNKYKNYSVLKYTYINCYKYGYIQKLYNTFTSKKVNSFYLIRSIINSISIDLRKKTIFFKNTREKKFIIKNTKLITFYKKLFNKSSVSVSKNQNLYRNRFSFYIYKTPYLLNTLLNSYTCKILPDVGKISKVGGNTQQIFFKSLNFY